MPGILVQAYFAPVTPPPANNTARHSYCRCCVILWDFRYRYPPPVGFPASFAPRMFQGCFRYIPPSLGFRGNYFGPFGYYRLNHSMPYGPGPNIYQNLAPWNHPLRAVLPPYRIVRGQHNHNHLIPYRPHPLFRSYPHRYFLPNYGWYYY